MWDWLTNLFSDGTTGEDLYFDDWNVGSDVAASDVGSWSKDWSGTDLSWLGDVGQTALKGLGSQAGLTGLGGLLGYLDAKGSPNSTTTTEEPWTAQQPYLLDAFQGAASAAKGNDLTRQANQNYNSVLQGPTVNPMLGMDNPYLQKSIDNANADVTRAMNPAMIAANKASGSYGNSGVAETYGRAMNDAYSQNATNMRMQDYGSQQQLQQQNVNNTLGYTTNAQSWAAQPSSIYANTVGNSGYGGNTSTPLYPNSTTGLLGGAITGYAAGMK